MSRILTVDPGTNCGWCIFTPETDYIYGVNKYPKTMCDTARYPCFDNQLGEAERFSNFYKDMESAIAKYDLTTLVLESNLMQDRSEANARLHFGWQTMSMMLCRNKKIPRPFTYTTGQWRKLNWGSANRMPPKHLTTSNDRRAWNKARSMQKALDLGYATKNDDEAEAILLCRAHRLTVEPKLAFENGHSAHIRQEVLI